MIARHGVDWSTPDRPLFPTAELPTRCTRTDILTKTRNRMENPQYLLTIETGVGASQGRGEFRGKPRFEAGVRGRTKSVETRMWENGIERRIRNNTSMKGRKPSRLSIFEEFTAE